MNRPSSAPGGGGGSSRPRVFVLMTLLGGALLWVAPDQASALREAVRQALAPGERLALWTCDRAGWVYEKLQTELPPEERPPRRASAERAVR